MIVRRLHRLADALPIREEWNRLADGIPFRQWEWMSSWWEYFCHRGELYVLTVEDTDGKLVGIAPWYIEQCSLTGRTVRFLGAGEACSDYQGVLAAPGRREEVNEALAQWLVGTGTGVDGTDWDVIHLEAVHPDDAVLLNLIAKLRLKDCQVYRQPSVNCWRIPLPDSWDKYLNQLSKPHRKHMRQVHQRLANRDFRATSAVDDASWKYTWERFVDLHQRRRKSLGGTGCFANTFFHDFLGAAAERFFRQGQLRLVLIEKDDTPVSSLLQFTGGGVAYAYQMGTNPDFMADSPGWLLVAASVQTGIEQRQTGLDLLRGNEPYKTRMGAKPIALDDVRIIPPQLGAKLRHTAWLTGLTVKGWIKTGLNAAGITVNAS